MTETRPSWPRCAASSLIVRDDRVLLVQRAKGTFTGIWSPPGGHIEPGEKAADAALRELREETGIAAELLGVLDVHDVIALADDGTLRTHYVLAVYYGRWLGGEPVAASDSRAARFFTPSEVAGLQLTDGARPLIARAIHLVGRA